MDTNLPTQVSRNRQFYAILLYEVLLEIRWLRGNDLQVAPALAYIFHNVPSVLHRDFTNEYGEEVWSVILTRANSLNLLQMVQNMEQNVLASLRG